MFEFLVAPENLPFAVALLVLLIIAIMEGVGSLLGMGLSNILDALFPNIDLDMNMSGADIDSPNALSRVLSWLRVGKVPVLVLLIVFLAGFGISGLIVQKFLFVTFGMMLPAPVASVPAFFAALPVTRFFGSIFHKILPKDETSAVSSASFVGRMAKITLGTSAKDSPAQGKVKDQFGKYHYIMIAPDNDDDVFAQGMDVLLVRYDGVTFYAIENHNNAMSN